MFQRPPPGLRRTGVSQFGASCIVSRWLEWSSGSSPRLLPALATQVCHTWAWLVFPLSPQPQLVLLRCSVALTDHKTKMQRCQIGLVSKTETLTSSRTQIATENQWSRMIINIHNQYRWQPVSIWNVDYTFYTDCTKDCQQQHYCFQECLKLISTNRGF